MDFIQFSELFRSFLVRSRKDLRTIFEQVAVSAKVLPDSQGPENTGSQETTHSKKWLGNKEN